MLVLNSVQHDSRVLREAGELAEAGYEVRVYGRTTREQSDHVRNAFAIERVLIRSPIDRAIGLLDRAFRRHSTAFRPKPNGHVKKNRIHWLVRALRRSALAVHRTWVVISFNIAAARRVARWKPAVVHAHDLNTLPAAAWLSGRREVSFLVYDSHELWVERNRHNEYRPVARQVESWLEKRLIRRTDLVLTVSRGISEWLSDKYSITHPTVVRNASHFRPRGDATLDIRKLCGVSAKARLIAYSGRITSGRGLELVIQSLPLVPPDVHLVLIGFGSAYPLSRIERLARTTGVSNRVHHIGAVESDSVAEALSGANAVFVLGEPICLSYELSLPNKLFEAIQARVPILTNAELREASRLVREHGIGKVVSLDPLSIANGFTQVLETDFDIAAFDAAAQKLSWENERHLLLAAYRRMLGDG